VAFGTAGQDTTHVFVLAAVPATDAVCTGIGVARGGTGIGVNGAPAVPPVPDEFVAVRVIVTGVAVE
jgi:hypothetical protein